MDFLEKEIKKLGVDVPKVMRLLQTAVSTERDKDAFYKVIAQSKNDVRDATEAIRQQAQNLRGAVEELKRIHGGPWPDDNDDDFLRDNPVLAPLSSNTWRYPFREALRAWMQEHIPADALDGLAKAIAACEAEALQSSGISHLKENAEYRGPEIPQTLHKEALSETTIQIFAEIAGILKASGCAGYMKKTADLFASAGIAVDVESIRRRIRRMSKDR